MHQVVVTFEGNLTLLHHFEAINPPPPPPPGWAAELLKRPGLPSTLKPREPAHTHSNTLVSSSDRATKALAASSPDLGTVHLNEWQL